MYEVWMQAALWVGLALVATLLSIWLRVATALSEIVVGTVAQLLIRKSLDIHVLTADTFGLADTELAGIDCSLHILSGDDTAGQKDAYVQGPGAEQVIAIGNGNNDRLMLKTARLGIAVIGGEGSAVAAMVNADIAVRQIHDALGLLLNPQRCLATLRG